MYKNIAQGIFDQQVSISEKMMAGLMKKDAAEVKKQLQYLHQSGVIEYQPQKDSPQLYLLRNRIKTDELSVNMVLYNERKDQFRRRMKQMIYYVKETTECRSRMIGIYFGDAEIKPCGICDNCLNQKASVLSKDEFDAIHHRIINLVKYESLAAKELLAKLSGVKKEKAWKVIEFLQAENKIEMDKTGRVTLK
jgi:ATP-dependent DNA helicase RecQ